MEILILFLPYLIEFLQECLENRERSEIEAGLRNPGLLERLACRKLVLRVEKLRGPKLWARVDALLEELRSMDEDSVRSIVDKAEAGRSA